MSNSSLMFVTAEILVSTYTLHGWYQGGFNMVHTFLFYFISVFSDLPNDAEEVIAVSLCIYTLVKQDSMNNRLFTLSAVGSGFSLVRRIFRGATNFDAVMLKNNFCILFSCSNFRP